MTAGPGMRVVIRLFLSAAAAAVRAACSRAAGSLPGDSRGADGRFAEQLRALNEQAAADDDPLLLVEPGLRRGRVERVVCPTCSLGFTTSAALLAEVRAHAWTVQCPLGHRIAWVDGPDPRRAVAGG